MDEFERTRLEAHVAPPSKIERYERALRWIVANAHDEEELNERAVCPHSWHRKRSGGHCPQCFSEWWAADGSRPAEEGSYAIQAVARQALAEEGS